MFFIPAHITVNIIYGIVTPYLPVLMRNLGYSAVVVGILLAITEGAGILGPFLLGRLADRSGKYKGYIILAHFLTGTAALPLAFFANPAISAIFVIVLAVGFRSSMPLIDAITTIHLGEDGDYGRIRVSGSIAFVCFLFFLQWVPVLRPNVPVNIAIWICITSVLAITVIILLPAKYTIYQGQPGDASAAVNKTARKKSIWTPVLILGIASIAFNRLAMTPIYSFFPLYLVEYMHWDAVGLMLALGSIAEIPFIFFSNRLIKRFGAMPILAFTSAMVALRLALYAMFPYKAGIVAAQLLHAFCFGLFHPAAVAFISDCVPPDKRSFGMTLYLSLGCGIPMVIGNFLGGFVVEYAGYRFLFGCFTIFAIFGTLLYVFFRLKETSSRRLKQS